MMTLHEISILKALQNPDIDKGSNVFYNSYNDNTFIPLVRPDFTYLLEGLIQLGYVDEKESFEITQLGRKMYYVETNQNMDTAKPVHKYFITSLILLSENPYSENGISLGELYKLVEVPEKEKWNLHDALWHNSYVDCLQQSIGDHTIIRINEKGKTELSNIQNEHFEKTGHFIIINKTSLMTYDETLEFIFQEHKKNNGKLWVYHGSMDPFPEYFTDARKEMILSGVIIQDDKTAGISRLNPKIKNCNSYDEAEEKLNQSIVVSYVDNSMKSFGDNSPIAGKNLSARDFIKNETDSESKDLAKKSFNWTKWGTIIGVFGVLLAVVLYLLQKYHPL